MFYLWDFLLIYIFNERNKMKKDKNIIVEVKWGIVVDVKNLPDGWTLEVIDHDEAGKKEKLNTKGKNV